MANHYKRSRRGAAASALHPLLITLCAILAAGCGEERDEVPKEPEPQEEGCPALAGPGTEHSGSLEGDEVWTAAGSPHLITSSVMVGEGMTLTLEPCAVVQIEARQSVVVRGALVADGTADKPVLIEAADAAAPFASLRAERDARIELSHTRVAHGGDGTLIEAMLEARGVAAQPRRAAITLDHVELDGSTTFGVWLEGNAALGPASQALTIKGAALGPLKADPEVAGSLPTGAYTGNGVDEVLVTSTGASSQLDEDTTWAARGVPYRVEGLALRVGLGDKDAPEVVWTLEPGAVVRMAPDVELFLNSRRTTASPDVDISNGTIRALGSAEAPITFEGVDATPGSWRGLVFRAAPTADSKLAHVIIAHAGGESRANSYHCSHEGMGKVSRDEDAAITMFGAPPADLITDSIIRDSAADGINHAYTGSLVDLMPSNTFERVARCAQTMPRPVEDLCPQAPYCPAGS